jgi:hypothetical protein
MTVHISNERGADGFLRLTVETTHLRAEFIPQLGGKLAQLIDRRTQRRWLWRHPRLPYQECVPTANYVAEADTGGWDECFPTVGACQYPDAAYADVMVPDHGDLWCQAPEMQVDHSDHDAEIITRWRGLQLPYTFVRTMHIQHDTVTVSYAVHNHGQAPLHWIWCAHPLIAIAPGMQLHLPPETTFWRMTEAGLREEPATAIAVTPTQRWDMRRMPEHDAGYSVKLYSAQLPAGHVRLQATDGALVWSWSTAEIPQLAVFLNAGGWSNDDGPPHFNLGLEPAIGVYDALSDAYAHTQSYATLDPGQQRRWQLTVQLVADNPQ